MKETIQKENWFERWLEKGGSFPIALVPITPMILAMFALIQNKWYTPYIKVEETGQLAFILTINFILGLIASFRVMNLLNAFVERLTKKWENNDDEKQGLRLSFFFIIMYLIHMTLQFRSFSKQAYYPLGLISSEVLLILVSFLLAGFVFIKKTIQDFKNFMGIRYLPSEDKIESITKISNNSFEKEFPEFILLKEKLTTLHTYEGGISEKEIKQLYNNFKELYIKYKELSSPQKEKAHEQILKAIIHKETEVQKRMDAIQTKKLERIERKVNRMMNQS